MVCAVFRFLFNLFPRRITTSVQFCPESPKRILQLVLMKGAITKPSRAIGDSEERSSPGCFSFWE